MIYLLTIQDKRGPDFNTTKTINADDFHDWVKAGQGKIGLHFQSRLEQLRKYTNNRYVIDWTMEEESTSNCADCGKKIPAGQRLCNCNTSGDIG